VVDLEVVGVAECSGPNDPAEQLAIHQRASGSPCHDLIHLLKQLDAQREPLRVSNSQDCSDAPAVRCSSNCGHLVHVASGE
jgi:hypothetical protein